jgi:hypothetical protein
MTCPIGKSALTPARKWLVEQMQRLGFGQLCELQVRSGEPVLHPPPRVVRDVKFASEDRLPPERGQGDFLLKQQIIELFAYFDQLQDGVIDVIEVKHGLPFRLQHSDTLA